MIFASCQVARGQRELPDLHCGQVPRAGGRNRPSKRGNPHGDRLASTWCLPPELDHLRPIMASRPRRESA